MRLCGPFLCSALGWFFFFSLDDVAAATDCLIEIDPKRVVVKYGDPVSVNCTATRTTRGMGWEASVGSTGLQPNSTQTLLWSVSNMTDWTAEPKCYANFQTEPKQCEKKLNISLYKYPDSVSISSVGHTGPVEEGRPYRLQCDVQSIAPVQYLSVNWYRGGALIHTETFTEDTTRTPVNVSRTLLITPNRTDDRVQYSCEAELRLEPEGPQPNPIMKSGPLNVTMLFKPVFHKAAETLSVSPGGRIVLNCSAEGKPHPDYSWNYTAAPNVKNQTMDGVAVVTITGFLERSVGIYTCTARNSVGESQKTFKVELKSSGNQGSPGRVIGILIGVGLALAVLIFIFHKCKNRTS
ncbi:vascular cell adhesion protein 1 [Amia ocellicauda]|uniref:vascular cell adhesion protein 1 n=1 Tax=Amia ocellicauda TaxID=2972642 RepID=UPI003463A2C3